MTRNMIHIMLIAYFFAAISSSFFDAVGKNKLHLARKEESA
ncbi:hypothetical protein [Kluyvera georgiana]|nr:hypothetical protein [Kluyvera georgiana]